MEQNLGIQTTANPDRQLEIVVDEVVYNRYPVKTKLVPIGYNYLDLVEEFALPHYRSGDFLVISEKVISICQKRVVHESQVKVSLLAKLICKFVTKYPDDVGFENPRKMQVAINESGYMRMVFAVIGGGIMKYVFRKPGWFYRIAGNQINVIDGFNPIAIPPFNEYAMLAPQDPDRVCEEIEHKFKIPSVIVDASNVATAILGFSRGVTKLGWNEKHLQLVLEGNPMGQEDEHTPLLLIRKS